MHALYDACLACESVQDALENVPKPLLDHVTVPAGAAVLDSWTVAVQVVAEPTTTVDFEHVTPRSVTVNVAVALLISSLTVIVLEPRIEEDGTVNMQPEFMLPDTSVVQLVGMPAVEPSYVTVRLCEAMKPVPVTVTVVPAAPSEGLRATPNKVSVKLR